MSQRPISRSPDLRKLVDEGYQVSILQGFLVVRGIPYLDSFGRIRTGTLVSTLELVDDTAVGPGEHHLWFAGSAPHDADGRPLVGMLHPYSRRDLGGGLMVDHMLCSKPLGREFLDYHEKIVTYAKQISAPAAALDATASARLGHVVVDERGRSPFRYVDTASARAGVSALTARLSGQRIGIVGLGGTGGYVLDLVSKTPVNAIHLFDRDRFQQHNAFRAPGAAAPDRLGANLSKVGYFAGVYSNMHLGIVPHEVRIVPDNYGLLDRLDFVFVCLDEGGDRSGLIRHLEKAGVSYADVGLGLHVVEAGLTGTVRLTYGSDVMERGAATRGRLPPSGLNADDPYSTNVQVADLNCLAASLAVIRWKRRSGFYLDLSGEHFSAYSVDGNYLINEDMVAERRDEVR